MAYVTLPHFGAIDSDSLENYYDVTIPFNNTQIQVDLNFETGSIDPKRLETVKSFIENIRIYDFNNKGYIDKDYNNEDGDTARFYAEHHLEELGKDELAALIDIRNKTDDHEKLLLKKLQLVRVGIYPQSEDLFATFDYSIGKNITNYLVVINTDENGNLDHMTVESE